MSRPAWPPKHVTETVTGRRHNVIAVKPDPRVVETWCGRLIALVGSRYPGRPNDCLDCRREMVG